MKSEKWKRTGKAAAVCMLALCMAGCGKERQPEIIGERRTVADEGGQSRRPAGNSLEEMTAVPERYRAEWKEGKLFVQADARIELPDTEWLPVLEIENAGFSREVFENGKKALAEEYGVTWIPADAAMERGESFRDEKDEIILDCVPAGDENRLSLMWSITAGQSERMKKSGSLEARSLYDKMDAGAAERRETADQMEERARMLISRCRLEGYEKRRGRWIHNSYGNGEEEWIYELRFTPSLSGVPLTGEHTEKGNLTGPYLDISFFSDGMLNDFQLVGHFSAREPERKETFLLPFESIRELFEQYIRDEGQEQWVKVTRAALEYGFVCRNEKERNLDGELIPVWNFYGSRGAGSHELLLMSIRADDGRLME